jgi:1-acyl-sn-glycerol-3-phosphate acyltransferase
VAGAASRASARPLVTATGIPGFRLRLRRAIARAVISAMVHSCLRVRVEGLEHLPAGPAVLCFNHLSWLDPMVMLAGLPRHPPLFIFGPKETDMSRGARNRLMSWTGMAVPFRPDRRDMAAAARHAGAVLASGAYLAIAGEGTIHAGEANLLPLQEGAAFLAIRAGVPLVPVAVNGTSWVAFGRRIRIRIGEMVAVGDHAARADISDVTVAAESSLRALVRDYPDPTPPGRFWRWVSELFNEWPEGHRPGPQA